MLFQQLTCLNLEFCSVACVFDLTNLARNVILQNESLYKKILMYEPILINDLLLALQSINVKVRKNALMDFLDNQGIIYRTRSTKQNNENKRRKKERLYQRLNKMNSTLTKWQKKRLLRNQRRRLRYAALRNKTQYAKTKCRKSIYKNVTKLFKTRKRSKLYPDGVINSNKTLLKVRRRRVKKNKIIKISSVTDQINKITNCFGNDSVKFTKFSQDFKKNIYSVIENSVTKKKRGRPKKRTN